MPLLISPPNDKELYQNTNRDARVCVPYEMRFAKAILPQYVGAAHWAARVLIQPLVIKPSKGLTVFI